MSDHKKSHEHSGDKHPNAKQEHDELTKGVIAADATGMLANERDITLEELDLPPKPK